MILLLLACVESNAPADSEAPCPDPSVHGTVYLWGGAYSEALVVVRVDGDEGYTLHAEEDGSYSTLVPSGTPIGLMAQDPDGYCQAPEQTVTLEDCEELELDLSLPEDCALPG